MAKTLNNKVFKVKVNKKEVYLKMFKTINGLLKLTEQEMNVTAVLYNKLQVIRVGVSDNDIAAEILFSLKVRLELRKELGMTSMLYNNYISTLKKKGIVSKEGKLNPMFELDLNKKSTEVLFSFEIV